MKLFYGRGVAAPFILFFLAASFLLSTPALSAANPPAEISRAAYSDWLRAINSNVSPFSDVMFNWYEEQLRSPIPNQVNSDPDKIYVTVDRALRETIALEDSGDIEVGNTVGFEAYGILDVPVAVALETKLFYWGKPVGAREGETFPFDTVFSTMHETIQEKWGPGNYFSTNTQTGGGIVQNLHDDFTLLVRGNSVDGYVVFGGFYGPSTGENTATLAHISIVFLKPRPDGKTEYRQNVRQNGQSYKMFGIEFGRKNYGFNVTRIRQGVKALSSTMLELKNTGKIKENRP